MTKTKLLLTILVMLCLFNTVKAQVSGIVFRDYNGNGTRQNGAGYTEPLAQGVVVSAYNAAEILLATTTTNSSGAYAFTALQIPSGTAIRLEFTLPSSGSCSVNSAFDFASGAGATHGTAVRFLSAGAGAVNINFAINDPNDYLATAAPFTGAFLFTNRYHSGNATGAGTSAAGGVFYKMSYTSKGQTTLPASGLLATNAQIGTCYGIAYSKQADRVFTSAFMKRHNGFGPANGTFNNAPGSIYIINPNLTGGTGASSYFTSLDQLGFSTHNSTGSPAYGAGTSYTLTGTGYGASVSYPANGLGVIGTNVNRGLPNDSTTRSNDPAAFGQIGKVSLGDMEISDDGQFLFVTNFYDRKIYQLQLNNVKSPTSATVVNSWDLPNPPLRSTSGIPSAAATYTGANNGTNFYDGARGLQRPFALKYSRGKLYIGSVTTGEGSGAVSTQDNNTGNPEYTDLWAYVWELNPATGTFTSTPVLQFPLNFNRGTNGDGLSETWRPWTNTLPSPWTGTAPGFSQYQQPMFSDIEFDSDGTMVLGFRDRFGDQSGYDQSGLNGAVRFAGQAMGDMYRAYYNRTSCVFELEQNAKEGPSSAKVATAGINNGDGPSNYTTNNGEFYYRDEVYNGNTSSLVGNFHLNTVSGALALIKGTDSVVVTTMDPQRAWSSGVSWFGSTGGDNGRDYEMFAGAGAGTFPAPAVGAVGKANGLGDIELLNALAPTELGNRLWNDANGDGIQNAGESGLANITLELYANGVDNIPGTLDDVLLGSTTTNGSGEWYFNTGNVTDGDPGTAGNQAGPQPGIAYNIQVGSTDWSAGAGTGDLSGYRLSKTDKLCAGAADLSDNDAAMSSNNVPMISLTIASAGQNTHDLDFGFTQLTWIGDKVWRDDDQDGSQDSGEPGIAGITITLYASDGTTVLGTTQTDAYGAYFFDNLAAGTYIIGISLPVNYQFTGSTGTDEADAQNSDVSSSTGKTTGVILSAGEKQQNIDAGLIYTSSLTNSIGDRIWLDSDGDGTQNGTEPGLSGITVTLYAADGVTVVASTVSDANGNYSFTGLPASTNYIVGITYPAGMILSSSSGSTSGNTTVNNDLSPVTGKSGLINTGAAGNVVTGVDAGLVTPAAAAVSIGDFVWLDLAAGTTGVQESGEPGVPGITVNLYRDANGDGVINGAEATTPFSTTVTDVFGRYIFNNLTAAVSTGTRYQLEFVLPGGFTFTPALQGSDASLDSDPATGTGRTGVYTLLPGQRNLSIDAGLIQNSPAGSAQVGDKVWFDADGDGSQDAGETGLAGVTVTLYNNAGTAIAVTTSDNNGNYRFVNLAAGDYSIGFTNLPTGYSFTAIWTSNDANALNSDVNPGTGRTGLFTLSAGETETDLDAGLYTGNAAGLGTIGSKVWYDLAGGTSGVQEAGELGVAGITVSLLDAGLDGVQGNGDDGLTRTTMTNSLGEYIFTDLPGGNYIVQYSTLPAGYSAATQNAGTNDALDSDGAAIGTAGAPAGASRTALYNLAAGEDNMTIDLGLVPPANTNSMGNFVWFDTNNDGLQAGEQGVAGVLVTLYNSGGSAIATTTTNAAGEYLFAGLADGTYSVGFANLPAGFDFSLPSAINDATGSDANRATGRTTTVILNAGNRNDRTLDAGLVSNRAVIGNFVWLDTDGDGVQDNDGSEPGVAGVTVTVFRPGFGPDGIAGNADDALPVASMITDQNGQYLFSNLLPGDYQLLFSTLPAGLVFTTADAGGDDALDSDAATATGLTPVISLSAGTVNLTTDAGLFKPRAVIGNYVWADANNDGIQDPGERGFAGVLITLLNSLGNPVASAVTDAQGGYQFPNVAPGTYSLSFSNLPSGVTFTTPNAGGDDNADSDVSGVSITGIVVNTTTTNLTFDAGLLNAITLPVYIQQFTAVPAGIKVLLNWIVSVEQNVDRYEVEYSQDGFSWTSIGSVQAIGSTSYSFQHLQPRTGINFYRIRSIDADASFKYSIIRRVSFVKGGSVMVYPNPVENGLLYISLSEKFAGKPVTLGIYSMNGQLVKQQYAPQAGQTEQINLTGLSKGQYLLRISGANPGNTETRMIELIK
jgi:protocatechuate 3,4-dioxygenase beta subunit